MRDPDNIVLTREQVREVDRRAVENYKIPGIVLMENAGRNAAHIIHQLFTLRTESAGKVKRVAIICGGGNNAGDGFVIARHLVNLDVDVEIFLASDPARLTADAATNFEIAKQMRITMHRLDTIEDFDRNAGSIPGASIIVDAMLGTGFSGEVRSLTSKIIHAINASGGPAVVAVDVPSGLDCDTGKPSNATVRADATVTFVAIKVGFLEQGASEFTGHVHVADIGSPREITQEVCSEEASG